MITERKAGCRIDRYESIPTFVHEARPMLDSPRLASYGANAMQPDKVCALALNGDPTLTARASDLVSKVEASAVSDAARYSNVHDVGGTRVDVPGYLAGAPRCMVRRAKRPTSTRHVNVYLSIACSGGLNYPELLTRGCTVLGLLGALQAQQVSVDLYLVEESAELSPNGRSSRDGGTLLTVIHVDAQPLDLSTISFAVGHPEFARSLVYRTVEAKTGYAAQWPAGFDPPSAAANGTAWLQTPYARRVREALSLSDSDVWIPPAYYSDSIVRDPEGWLAKYVSQITGQESDHV